MDTFPRILGLVEQPGIDTNNSLKDASHVTRPPLWETHVIGELQPVGAKTSAGVRAQ